MSNQTLLTDWCCKRCRRTNGIVSTGGGGGGGKARLKEGGGLELAFCGKHCSCAKYCSDACEEEDRSNHEGSCRRMRECMKELFASLPTTGEEEEALVAPQRPTATTADTATATRNSSTAAPRRGRATLSRAPPRIEGDGVTSDAENAGYDENMESGGPTNLKRVLARTLRSMQEAEGTWSEVQGQAHYELQLDEYLRRQIQNHPEEVGDDSDRTRATIDNFILDDIMNVEVSPRANNNANHNAAELRICKSRIRLAEALETVASQDFYAYEVSHLLQRALACRLDALGRNAAIDGTSYAKDCHHVLPFLLLRLNRDQDCFTFLRHCVIRDAVLRAYQPPPANNNDNNQNRPIDRVAEFHNFAGPGNDNNNNNNNVLNLDDFDNQADNDAAAAGGEAPADNDNVNIIHFPAFDARIDTHSGLLDKVPLEPEVTLSDAHVSFLLAAVIVKYRLVATCWSRVNVFYSSFAETPLAKLLDRDSLSVVLSFFAGTANVNRYVRRQEAFITTYLTEIHKRNPSVLPAILLPAPLLNQQRPKVLIRNSKTEAWDVVQRSVHLIYQIPGLKERIADFVGSYNPTYDYKLL